MVVGRTCVALATLAALCGGFPQGQDDEVPDRIDRPPTPEPPKTDECSLAALLGFEEEGCGSNSAVSSTTPSTTTTDLPYNPGVDPQGPFSPYPDPSTSSTTPPSSTVGDSCDCSVTDCASSTSPTSSEDYDGAVYGEGVIDERFGESCRLQCCPVYQPSTTSGPESPATSQRRCGVHFSDGVPNRITQTADNEALYGEFPWMIAVIRKVRDGAIVENVFLCGGSLIHPQVVLTAAHCVHGKDGLTIRAGEWDTKNKNEVHPTQDIVVGEVIVHEEFHSGTLINNPALLVLKSPVDMRVPSVGLICLPQPDDTMDGRTCMASGWGKDQWGKEGNYQEILKKVTLPIVAHDVCQAALRRTRLGEVFKLHHSFLCAGGVQGEDTCRGDGGSPLVCPRREDPDQYEQAGVVSWGINCGTETPGVYVNVAHFVNWIHNKLNARNIILD